MEKKAEMNKEVTINSAADLMALVARIDKGNPKPEDLKLLRQEMDDKPEVFRSIGNIQRNVFSEIFREVIISAFQRECAERYIEEMKIELGYQNSTFVERMLIDEIVMRWLRLQNMEIYHKNATSISHNTEQGMYVEKRLDMAQKRFLRSINTLAKVRKMIAQTQAKGAEMFKNLMSESSSS